MGNYYKESIILKNGINKYEKGRSITIHKMLSALF